MRAKYKIISKNLSNNLGISPRHIFYYKNNYTSKANLSIKINNSIRSKEHSKEKYNSITFKNVSFARNNNNSIRNIEKIPFVIKTNENSPFRKKSCKNISMKKIKKISEEKASLNQFPVQNKIKKLSLAEIINIKHKNNSSSKAKSKNASIKKNKKNVRDKSHFQNRNNYNIIKKYNKNSFRSNNNSSTSQKSILKNKNYPKRERYINSKKNIPKPFIYKKEKCLKKSFSPAGKYLIHHKRNNFYIFNFFKTEEEFKDKKNYESLDKNKNNNNNKNIIIKINNNRRKIRSTVKPKSKKTDKNISSYNNLITSGNNNKNKNNILNTKYCINKKNNYVNNKRHVLSSKKIEVPKKSIIKNGKNSSLNDTHTLIFLDKKLLDESKNELINNIKINNFNIKKPKEENMKYTVIKNETDNFDDNNSTINKSKIDKIVIGDIEGYKDIIESDQKNNYQDNANAINNFENNKNINNNSLSLYSRIINRSLATYDEDSEFDLNSNKDKNIRILINNIKSDSFDNL